MHAENDLSLLKFRYVNFHDKLTSKSQIIDIYEKYYNSFSAYTHLEEEISLYYDWTQDSPRDPPEDKMILFANLKSKFLLNDKMLKYFVDLVFNTHNPDHFLQLRNQFIQFFHSEITNFLSFEEIEFLFWLNAFSFSKFQNKFLNTIDGLFYRIQNPYFFKNVMKPEPVLNDLTKIKDYLNETITLIDFLIANLSSLLKESIDYILPDLEYFYIDKISKGSFYPRPNLPVLDDLVMLFDNHPRFKFLHIELSCIVQLLPSASDYLRSKNILFLHTKSEYLKHEIIITKEGQRLPIQSLSVVDYWKSDVLASFENYVTVRKNDQELSDHIEDLLKDIKDPRFSTLHREEQRIKEICFKEIETILSRK